MEKGDLEGNGVSGGARVWVREREGEMVSVCERRRGGRGYWKRSSLLEEVQIVECQYP